jgi:hypothetical protein
VPFGKNQVTDKFCLPQLQGRKRHTHMESDPGLFGDYGHRAQAPGVPDKELI